MAGGRALALFFLIAGAASLTSTVAGNQPSDPTQLITEEEKENIGRFAVRQYSIHAAEDDLDDFCKLIGFKPVDGVPLRFVLTILIKKIGGQDRGSFRVASALVQQQEEEPKLRMLSFSILPPTATNQAVKC
ncbi:hypothetical protein AXF42_Ash021279 [Apostasia shenzhenica]|uniref:Cystatin domain-containing protein n=1 Tax=Apostasia shenzhenica TaxID=1088818 RepID=A0A2I0AVT5_9ASPA|nr:hypothetical protein AXF42_Ash021279 [Apostasia shenzhenica]